MVWREPDPERTNDNGAWIPLDLASGAHVYQLQTGAQGWLNRAAPVRAPAPVLVSHFLTCTGLRACSGERARKAAPAPQQQPATDGSPTFEPMADAEGGGQ